LIEVSDIDIYDIPIADITEQYFMVIKNSSLEELDMELAKRISGYGSNPDANKSKDAFA